MAKQEKQALLSIPSLSGHKAKCLKCLSLLSGICSDVRSGGGEQAVTRAGDATNWVPPEAVAVWKMMISYWQVCDGLLGIAEPAGPCLAALQERYLLMQLPESVPVLGMVTWDLSVLLQVVLLAACALL